MKRSTWITILLLAGAIAFNLVVLWPEVAVETPTLNDNTLHLALVQRAADALERGEDPTDPWVSNFVEGYPLLHHYQHLPHVVTALIYEALGGAVRGADRAGLDPAPAAEHLPPVDLLDRAAAGV